jgi:hypothetical protein
MSDGGKVESEVEDEAPPPSAGGERRRQERIAAAVVTELLVDGTPHMAMLHDFSSTGALVLTRTRVAVDDRVELRIHLGESLEQTLLTAGAIVRVEPWADGESFWPLSVAVRFDEAATGHEARLRAIAARQVELGLLPGKG